MKQLILTLILCLFALPAMALQKQAVVTFYWPGEDGGRRSCDGKRLTDGDAAVNFDVIPKGSQLTLEGCNGSMDVTANDCGGSAVIARTAAHERGFHHAIVIDVWAPDQDAARDMERSLLGKKIGRGACLCTINYVPPHKEAIFTRDVNGRPRFDGYAMSTNRIYTAAWSSKFNKYAFIQHRHYGRNTDG